MIRDEFLRISCVFWIVSKEKNKYHKHDKTKAQRILSPLGLGYI